MVLFINCCPREESRTKRLADAVLKKYGTYEEIDLYSMDLKPVDKNRLDLRTELLNENRLDADEFSLSRQFADARQLRHFGKCRQKADPEFQKRHQTRQELPHIHPWQ